MCIRKPTKPTPIGQKTQEPPQRRTIPGTSLTHRPYLPCTMLPAQKTLRSSVFFAVFSTFVFYMFCPKESDRTKKETTFLTNPTPSLSKSLIAQCSRFFSQFESSLYKHLNKVALLLIDTGHPQQLCNHCSDSPML